MRKRFVKVMLYGVLALATSASFVGCTDYDDDVKNLQEQIDNINKGKLVSNEEMDAAIQSAVASLQKQLETAISGKADNQAVVDLQAKVEAFVKEMEGKADAAKLTELANEIKALSAEVNTVKGSLDETKKALEAKVADLEAKLAKTADKTVTEQLAKDLATAQNDLAAVKKMATDNAAAIVEIKTNITKLEGLETRIRALEDANKDFALKGDLAAYTKTSEMEALVNSYIAKQLAGEGSIAKYVDNAIATKIAAELVAVNNRISVFDSKLTGLDTKIGTVAAKLEKGGEIFDKITALETWKAELTRALTDAKFESFAAVFAQINKLTAGYANCITTENVNASIQAYINEELKKNDGVFAELQTRITALENTVEALKNKIQSIVFIPEDEFGGVVFFTLQAKNSSEEYTTVAQSGNIQVKFRVSPASAAKGFVDGKYSVSFDAQLFTRAAGIFEVVGQPTLDADDNGIVIYTLKSNSDKNYAVCMQVTKAATQEKEDYTNLSSNYFTVYSRILGISDVRMAFDPAPGTTLNYDGKAASVTSISYVSNDYEVLDEQLEEWTDLSTYGLDGTKLFTTTYAKTDAKASFKLADGVLTLGDKGAAADGHTATVTATIKIKSLGAKSKSYAQNFDPVTASATKESFAVSYAKSLNWSASATNVNCELSKIATVTGISVADLKGYTITPVAGSDVMFKNALTGENLVAVVPKAQAAGTYTAQVKLTSSTKEITATLTVNISNLAIPAFVKLGSFWDGDNVYLPGVVDADAATKVTISQDLTKLFSNYAAIVAAAVGGTISFEGTLPIGVSMSGTTLRVDPANYLSGDIVKTATVKLGDYVAQKQKINVVLTDLNGNWTNATKLVAAFTDKNVAVSLPTGFIWKDTRGKEMWKDGALVVGTGSNGFANTVTNPLSLYGLKAPTYKIEGEYAKYFELSNDNKKISFKSDLLQVAPTQDIVVDVVISATSKWGAIPGLTGGKVTIKVTLPKAVANA